MAILIEAFPGIEPAVIKAVLTASRGELEPAFNALLGMSDPDAVIDEPAPPPPPPRNPDLPPRRSSRPPQQGDYTPAGVYYESGQQPGARGYQTTTPRSQLEADELYARQLAEDLGAIPRPHANERVGGSRSHNQGQGRGPNAQGRRREDEYDEREHSFLDDDFPVIKENLRKGFLETQAKVNKWVLDFKKKIDGEDEADDHPPAPPPRSQTFGQFGAHNNFGRDPPSQQRQQQQNQGGYQTAPTRPRYSTDNYDADPTLLTDDFRHLEVRDNTTTEPSRPARPAANPNLLSSDRTKSDKPSGRKVSFQDDNDDDDMYAPPSSKPPARQPSPGTSTATNSKWQPLRSVEPTPLDRDPFGLGDSDDEKEHETPAPVVDAKPGVAGEQKTGVKGGEELTK